AAFYFVAARISNVFAMISASISTYAVRRISRLFYSDGKEELQSILHSLAMISAAVAIVAFAIITLGGHTLLWMFGSAYWSAYPTLMVLTAGAALTALAGPAAHILLLTGYEGIYPRIMAAGLAFRFMLICVLGPSYGLMGAAIAWSLSAL